ncbi:EthD domain-containing protein [soil metagenome]
MFILWGEDLAATLRAVPLHEALAALGVERLQVNVDDEPVARAMRLASSKPAIGAVVSVWGKASPAAVVEVLRGAAERLTGWEVEERRPIAPPETWDGARVDALANVAVLRRPAELGVEEWKHRWLVDHTPVAIATQGTFGYLQNVVVGPVTGPEAELPVAALVEELFPMAGIEDIHAFYGSGGSDAELNDRITRLMASVARFGADRDLDLVPTSRYLYDLARTGR